MNSRKYFQDCSFNIQLIKIFKEEKQCCFTDNFVNFNELIFLLLNLYKIDPNIKINFFLTEIRLWAGCTLPVTLDCTPGKEVHLKVLDVPL